MKTVHAPCLVVALVAALLAATACKDDEKVDRPVKAKAPAPAAEAKKATTDDVRKVAKAAKSGPADRALPAARPAGNAKEVAKNTRKTPPAREASKPAPGARPAPAPGAVPAGPVESNIPDLRLLLTATDVTQVGGGKTAFRRRAMPGMEVSADRDALYYEPEKGSSFGFGIQVFHERNAARAKQRFESMFASYPNAVEIAPVAGNTFFAYWDEVLFVSFMHQYKGMIVVLSCGRPYCDSDSLYALAKKVGSRIR